MWAGFLVWACAAWQVWAAFIINGTYFASSPPYKNVLPRRFFKNYMITKKTLMEDVVSGKGLMECGRLCLTSPRCFSLILQHDPLTCILTSLNRCQDNDSILLYSPGSVFYERFDGRRDSQHTCFPGCFSHGGCHACGRPSCWGSGCEECATNCWEAPGNNSGKTILWWRNMRNIYSAVCEDGWQLLWRVRNLPPGKTPQKPLKLRLRLVYAGNVRATSHFSSVKVEGKRLSVGNYLGGEAGNWWEAPFNDRKLAFNSSLNCRPFFNPTSHCEANNIVSIEEQQRRNISVVKRGFAWITGSEYYDNLWLKTIELWMKCTECLDEEK